jgi:hypothetical protein
MTSSSQRPKVVHKWNYRRTERLLTALETKQELWDANHASHTNKALLFNLRTQLAEELSTPGK